MSPAESNEDRAAWPFILPFVAVYAVLFLFPTAQMVMTTFTDASLTLPGEWVGFDNYAKLFGDRQFRTSVVNTIYVVVLTVVPGTLIGLAIAMALTRLRGIYQGLILALFFLPYVLPVSVVANIWWGLFDASGILYGVGELLTGRSMSLFRSKLWFFPTVAFVTIWWTVGFNILLFVAGLRNIPPELYEAASIDNAGRWTQFRLITWPLIWPVTALVLTIQLILQLKIFDQVYLLNFGNNKATEVVLEYVYNTAFRYNDSGYGSTIALALFVVVMVCSVLQYQVLRVRSAL